MVKILKPLTSATLLLALVVIVLGAYTRLTDAGLGCPDWPGCYGLLHAPKHDHHIEQAQENYPGAVIEPHKAHNEMLHRYVAGFLGLCVLAIFILCQMTRRHKILSSVILGVVIFQAALGMWTVTLNLMPLVVMAHLLGGFTLLSLLALLRMEMQAVAPLVPETSMRSLLPLGYLALFVLIVQIALGGWTSANYAAVVCYELPFCESGWQEKFSLGAALSMPLGHETYEFGVLPYESRMSIHVMHRIGAIVTFLVLSIFCFLVWRKSAAPLLKYLAIIIGGLLVLQVCLGLANILAKLPLINAVAHNLVAANLVMLTLVLVRQIYLRRSLREPAVTSVTQQIVEG